MAQLFKPSLIFFCQQSHNLISLFVFSENMKDKKMFIFKASIESD